MKNKKIKNWLAPVLVSSLFLLMTRGVWAEYIEERLDLGGTVNLDEVVVKVVDDGHDREIYYSDGENEVRVTNNEYDDLLPVYDDGLIAWQGMVDNRMWQIFVYDLGTKVTTQLTFASYPSEYPKTSGGRVVWEMPKGVGSDIFLFDGLDVVRLTSSDEIDELPEIDGEDVIWRKYDGEDMEIMAYDVSSGVKSQLTNDGVDNLEAKVFNGEVFYVQFDGNDNEVYGMKIASGAVRQITNNKVNDAGLEIEKGVLKWKSKRDGDVSKKEEAVYVEEILDLSPEEPEVPEPSVTEEMTPVATVSGTPILSPSQTDDEEATVSGTPSLSPIPTIDEEDGVATESSGY